MPIFTGINPKGFDLSMDFTLSSDKTVDLYDLSGDGSKFFMTVIGRYNRHSDGQINDDCSCNFFPHTYSSYKIEALKREMDSLANSSFSYMSTATVPDVSFVMENKGNGAGESVTNSSKFRISQGDRNVSFLPSAAGSDVSYELSSFIFYNLMDRGGKFYQKMEKATVVYGTPDKTVSRYIFTNGTSAPSSWTGHLMGGHVYFVSNKLLWDLTETGKGLICGQGDTGSGQYLIWRENTIAKSFSNLYYYQTQSGTSYYMSMIYSLWGINSISADASPSEAGGWTLIGYFRIGEYNQGPGSYTAAQYSSSWSEINNGSNTTPLSTAPFGIWAILSAKAPYGPQGHGMFIGRISVNEETTGSLSDSVTTVLNGTLTYS